jgi:hypothetical protein
MRTTAATVEQYLAELPPERRDVVARVRDLVNAHLPRGYEESFGWGMICWGIPLARYPDTYNGQPLGYACLAAQKNHYALYLTGLYMSPEDAEWFARAFAEAGKKLDMGKSCLRFRAVDDLPLDVVGRAVSLTTPEEFIARYERVRAGTKTGARKAAAKAKSPAKSSAKSARKGTTSKRRARG